MDTPATPAPHSAPVSEKIPFWRKLAFASGTPSAWLATGVTAHLLWMPFFNIGMGMSPITLGVLLMCLQAWDAISDPLMGYVTDNARTRWGRRRPFIFLGAIAMAVLYPLLWRMPAGLDPAWQVVWLLGFGILLYAATTCWSIPFHGMQMEMTPNYDERTSLAAFMSAFGKLGMLVGSWLLAIASGPLFANPQTGEPDLVAGIHTCSLFVAGLILVLGLQPALFGRERFGKQLPASAAPAPAEGAAERTPGPPPAKQPFWKDVRESVRCAPLWVLIAFSFMLAFGNNSISALGQYVNFYYVCQGDIALGTKINGIRATIAVVTSLLSIPLWTWLSRKVGKRRMVMYLLGAGICGHLLNLLCMTPEAPYLQLVSAVFESTAMVSIWLFLPSMRADVADYDELHTHRRREGSLNAFFSWFFKLAQTSSAGIGGVVLSLTGFSVAFGKIQPPEVLERMFNFYIFLPIIIWGLGLIALQFYHLERGRMQEIREQLEARRGKV